MDDSHRVWFDNHGYLPDWNNKREVIHHKNGDHSDNRIENLQLMTQSEHLKLHHAQDGHPLLGRTGSNSPNYGQVRSEEQRSRISRSKLGNKSRLGIPHSEETKAKISAALVGKSIGKGVKRSAETREKMRLAALAREAAKRASKQRAGHRD